MESFLRARVLGSVEEGGDDLKIVVQFVDFGNISRVARQDVMDLETRFLNLPLQAFECALATRYKPPAGDVVWSEESTEAFFHLVTNRLMAASVVAVDANGTVQVELYDLANRDENVGEVLVAYDLADIDKPPEIPHPVQSIVIPG